MHVKYSERSFQAAAAVILLVLAGGASPVGGTHPSPPNGEQVLTIAQYRALMQRDMLRVQGEQAATGKDWQATIDAGVTCLRLERQVFGPGYPGDELTRGMLWISHLQLGDFDSARPFLPVAPAGGDGAVAGSHAAVAKILEDDQQREQYVRYMSLALDVLVEAGDLDSLPRMPLTKLEQLHKLADEMRLIASTPLLSWALAEAYGLQNEWQRALPHARAAFRDSARQFEGDWKADAQTLRAAKTLQHVLGKAAGSLEQHGRWDQAIPLREEAIVVATDSGRPLEPPQRSLARARRIAALSADERKLLALTDAGMESIQDLVARREIPQALKQVHTFRATYQSLLGADSDECGYCTKVSGFLYWNLGEYGKAFTEMTQATRLLMATRGSEDGLVQEAVADAFVNAVGHARSADDPQQFADQVGRFESFLTAKYDLQHPLPAAGAACRMHVARLASLNSEQRRQLVDLVAVERQRDQWFRQGNYSQAEPLARQIFERTAAVLGTADQRTHEALFALANVQNEAGMLTAAEANYRQLLEISDREPFHRLPYFGNRLHWFGSLLQKQGQSAEALRVLERAKAVIGERMGKWSLSYAFALRIQSRVYRNNRSQPALAQPLLRESAQIIREQVGPKHFEYAQALTELGQCEFALNRYQDAERSLREALTIRENLPHTDPWQTAWNRNELGRVLLETGRYEAAADAFEQVIASKERDNPQASDLAAVYVNLIQTFLRNKDEKNAQLWLTKFHASRQRAWGRDAPRYAEDLMTLASALMTSQGGYFFGVVTPEEAAIIEPLLRQAVLIRGKAFSTSSWRYAESLQRQANLEICRGRPDAAIPPLLEARRIATAAEEANALLIPLIASDLALAYEQKGDFARALPARLDANAGFLEVAGDDSPLLANSLTLTADLYAMMGDLDRAEDCIRRAATTFAAVGHQRATGCYAQLAEFYLQAGDLDRAEQYLHFANRLVPSQGTSLLADPLTVTSFARLYFARGDNETVVKLAEHALQNLPDESQQVKPQIVLRELLGRALLRLGDDSRAEKILDEVLSLRQERFGPDHIGNLVTLLALSELHARRGDDTQTVRFARHAVALAESHLDRISSVLSERQQLLVRAKVRRAIDHYFALGSRGLVDPNELYGLALRWKGGVFVRQRNVHRALNQADPTLKHAADELATVNRQLASMTFQSPEDASSQWLDRLKELTERKEALEGKLAGLHAALPSERGQGSQMVGNLQKQLPPRTVLVDYLRFDMPGVSTDQAAESRFLAFVVTAGQHVQVIDLGKAEPMEADIRQWRRAVSQSDARQFRLVGQRLRAALWSPLQQHLHDGDTILISPDGDLAQLPFAALPGSDPNSLLLENHRIAVVPVPQMLLDLPGTDARPASATSNVLLVGDINFDSSSSREGAQRSAPGSPSAARSVGGSRTVWPSLPGTKAEIESIRLTLSQQARAVDVQLLTKTEATEAAIRARIPKVQWLHLATHGFFAQADESARGTARSVTRSLELSLVGRESVPGFHPGLLSGLVMAGANRGELTDDDEMAGDDGILTAIEVAELDLRSVDVTVLSACETGLGEVNTGEGVLGLQRALQIAGSRTVVASLWKVDDRATQKLMEEFYRNIWERKLGKLDALRKAQLDMLQTYDAETGQFRGDRRLRPSSKAESFLIAPPVLWAAFVLSGDWR